MSVEGPLASGRTPVPGREPAPPGRGGRAGAARVRRRRPTWAGVLGWRRSPQRDCRLSVNCPFYDKIPRRNARTPIPTDYASERVGRRSVATVPKASFTAPAKPVTRSGTQVPQPPPPPPYAPLPMIVLMPIPTIVTMPTRIQRLVGELQRPLQPRPERLARGARGTQVNRDPELGEDGMRVRRRTPGQDLRDALVRQERGRRTAGAVVAGVGELHLADDLAAFHVGDEEAGTLAEVVGDLAVRRGDRDAHAPRITDAQVH